jgi:ABC-type multidrug transport system ATPase subunit/ABC-type multidrug transport system permease subunit
MFTCPITNVAQFSFRQPEAAMAQNSDSEEHSRTISGPSSEWRTVRVVDEDYSSFPFNPREDGNDDGEAHGLELKDLSHIDQDISQAAANGDDMADTSFDSVLDTSIVLDDIASTPGLDEDKKHTKERWVPMTLKFNKLSFSIMTSTTPSSYAKSCFGWFHKKLAPKKLLDGISGRIVPGELVAVMGSSGAGKSTFLDVLSNRVNMKMVEGALTVNDVPVTEEISRECFGYVWQDDTLHEHLTVRETLLFVYKLRFGSNDSSVAEERVDQLIKELGLMRCANTQVGRNSFRGISGGEAKRLSIGIELISNPRVILLDEPTTGLDSKTALQIMQLLRKLADQGKIVIVTIHQPQRRIYELFDKILLLAKGGRPVYFGPGREEAVDYFDNLGFECDAQTTPSDHFVDLVDTYKKPDKKEKKRKWKRKKKEKPAAVTEDAVATTEGESGNEWSPEGQTEFIIQSYLLSSLCQKNESESLQGRESPTLVDDEANQNPDYSNVTEKSKNSLLSLSLRNNLSQFLVDPTSTSSNAGFFGTFAVLFRRHFLEFSRNRAATFSRILQSIVVALVIGMIYYGLGQRFDQKAALDRRGVLFFLSLQQGLLGFISVLMLFQGWERLVFRREYFSSLYDCKSYFFSKLFAELPFQIVSPILFGVITYFMVGFQYPAFYWQNFGLFMLVLLLSMLVGQGLGMFVSVLTPNLEMANVVCPLVLGISLLSGGFLITLNNFPRYLIWLPYMNFVKYSNEILSVNGLTGLNFTCARTLGLQGNSTAVATNPSSILSIFNPNNSTVKADIPCLYRNGQQLLESIGYNNVSVRNNLVILTGMIIIFQVLSYIGLRYIVVRHKK